MASILRSTKLVRYFAGIARSIVFSNNGSEGTLVNRSHCLCNSVQNYGSHVPRPDQNLDQSLRRIDQDVRRSGRISRRDLEEVLDEIRQQRTATSSQSLLVIRCCGNLVPEELPEVRTALVQEIWRTLNNLNVPMDISHFNALLRVYLENEHPFSPTEFLADLEAKGVEPNRVTYQRLISRYCQEGDIEGATRILEFMREKQHPVNEYVFNALIMGHSQAEDFESAEGILSVMKQAGLEPSADTYTTLLCGYAKKGDIEAILKKIAFCEEKEIYLLDKDLLEVIYSLAMNNQKDHVERVVEKLRKSIGYNQDAFNLILRLTNKGHEDVGLQILRTMARGTNSEGELSETGNFFIRQMVKGQIPVERIVSTCQKLSEENLNKKGLLIAVEAALSHGLIDSVMELLKEAKKDPEFEVRQHYFWPILVSASKSGKIENVTSILNQMEKDFNIPVSSETIRSYVIPNLKEKNPDKLMDILIGTGISTGRAVNCVCYSLLSSGQLKEAANLAVQYKAYFQPNLFRKPLTLAFSKTKDVTSYVKFLRHLHDSLERFDVFNQNQPKEDDVEAESNAEQEDGSSSNAGPDQAKVLGQFVADILTNFRNDKVEILDKVLQALIAEGLSISSQQADYIQNKLGSQMTEEISTMLSKLAAGDLEPVPRETGKRSTSLAQMNPEQIEKLIATVEAKGENTNKLKRYLISACMRNKDVQKSEEVIDRFEKEGYVMTSGVYAQLIDLYCHHEQLDKALEIYNKIKAKEVDFTLDNLKTVKIASQLIKEDKFDDAIKILEENKKEEFQSYEHTFNYNAVCWRVLNGLAEKGKAEELNKLFDLLESGNYVEANNVILGPLIKVHLVNDDLTKAMQTFETITNKYRSTPWKNDLACRLIQTEDAINLQKLTDLSTSVHGEVNSLYDLVFSFVECGRIRQARKILETPGLRARYQRINHACERYREEGMVQSLEGLIEATKDLNHIDRSDIYYNLLLTYKNEKQPEKALGLWTKMQEEDITPTDSFLNTLAQFLKENNQPIPFNVPSESAQPSQRAETSVEKKSNPKFQVPKQETQLRSQNSDFKSALNRKDLTEAGNLFSSTQDQSKFSIGDLSKYVELLVQSNNLSDATKVVRAMVNEKRHPHINNFKFYLNKVANNGDFKTLSEISQQLSVDLKKQVSFDNRVCHSYIVAGQAEQYLSGLEKELESAKNQQEIDAIGEKFPRGGAVGILERHPELSGRFEELAEKYAAKGQVAPMNVLWVYHFSEGNAEASERIWTKYLTKTPRLMFQRIVHVAREKQDETMILKLIDVLKSSNLTAGALGNAYSCLVDVYVGKEKLDEGLKVVESVAKEVGLENINRTALQRLKEGVEKAGKAFNFEIPKKTQRIDEGSSSSSSSSSDDEPPRK